MLETLGLYREDGSQLQHVGVAASFPMARRKELVDELAPYRMADEDLSQHPWGRWAEAQAHEPEDEQAGRLIHARPCGEGIGTPSR